MANAGDLTAVQKTGPGGAGALVFSVLADVVRGDAETVTVFKPTPDDSVTLVFSDRPEDRWDEITEVIDHALAVAVDRFGRYLG